MILMKRQGGYWMNNNRIFFLHVPRTMGTTLKNIFLAPLFEPGSFQENLEWTGLVHSSPGELGRYRFIAGHLNYGANKKIQAGRIITSLRQPVQRSYSMFDFVNKVGHHYLHNEVKEKSLKEVAESPQARHLISNYMVRYIGNNMGPGEIYNQSADRDNIAMTTTLETTECTQDLFELACHNLDQMFFVNIARYFRLGLYSLYDKLGVVRIESNVEKAHVYPISQYDYDLLKSINKYDLMLYDYAVDIFHKKTEGKYYEN